MPSQNDWRRQGQERYLSGLEFQFKKYQKYSESWDHDHCEFCGCKFSEAAVEDSLQEGYATEDHYRWVCKACFNNFLPEFNWSVK